MASKNKPILEWKADTIDTIDATITNGRIELGLRDDQIAEIHKVESSIAYGNIPDVANDMLLATKALSMDPDVDDSPVLTDENEDLEWFFYHPYHVQQEVGAAGSTTLRLSDNKTENYDPPIVVGTDIGQVVIGDPTVPNYFLTRVFFTRRKATAAELAQVLLKRK